MNAKKNAAPNGQGRRTKQHTRIRVSIPIELPLNSETLQQIQERWKLECTTLLHNVLARRRE